MPERIVVERADGGISVVCPAPGFSAEDCMKDVPAGALQTHQCDEKDIISDRVFRDAWVWERTAIGKHVEDVAKAQEICHGKRRVKRDKEMAPHDIHATVPHLADEAEAARVIIRAKHAQIQTDIDASTTPEELKAILAREAI